MKFLFKNYPILLIIVAFAPYLSMGFGLKVEDLVIYPLAVLSIILSLLRNKIKINKSILGLIIVWASISFYSLVRTLIGGGQRSTHSFIADINNFAQPLAIILLFLLLIYPRGKTKSLEILKSTSYTLLIMLSLNSLWILLGFFVDLSVINSYFWGSGAESIAASAASNGRFSGTFNQPIEAGIAYSVGLIVWLYLIEKKYMKVNIGSVLILLLLFIGGSLTVSKVFVVLGVVLFTLGVFTNNVVRRRILPIGLLFVGMGYPAYLYLTKTWDGLNYLLRLFDSSNYQAQGFLTLLTAGRYGGEDSQQSNYFAKIWNHSPIIGEGMGSQITYDSAHFYFFSIGGLIGLIGYIVLIGVFIWLLYEIYVYTKFRSEFKLFLGVFVLIVAGGLGAPALTLNRSSIILWVFVGLILQYLCAVKTERYKLTNDISIEEERVKPTKQRKRWKRYRLTW